MEIANIKCGEIYLTKNSSYYFYCIHCETKVFTFDDFKNHNLNHFIVDESDKNLTEDISKTSEIKIEFVENDEIKNTNEASILECSKPENFGEYDIKCYQYSEKSSTYSNDSQYIEIDLEDFIKGDYNDHDQLSNNNLKINMKSDDDLLNQSLDNSLIFCNYCKLSFPREENHEQENCRWVQNKIFNCGRNLELLKIQGIFLCDSCPKFFNSQRKLRNHCKTDCTELREHKDIKRNNDTTNDIKLEIMDEEISPYETCDLEIKAHNKKEYIKIKNLFSRNNFKDISMENSIKICPEFRNNQICKAEYESPNFGLSEHYKNGCCLICNMEFDSIEIAEHLNSVHLNDLSSTESKILKCQFCERKFTKEVTLKRHQETHRQMEMKNKKLISKNDLKCQYCHKIFKNMGVLREHIRIHTGERPFKCQQCSAAFAVKHNLNMHIIYKHTEEKHFQCRFEGGCGKAFKTSQLRNYHERRHTGEILGKCEFCDREYRNKSALRKHIKLRHMDYNERPHECEYCDQKFIGLGFLKEHVRMHTGEKPLQCNICLKSFGRASVLREHKKLHTDKKNYICNFCGKTFAQAAGYFSHLKNHKQKFK